MLYGDLNRKEIQKRGDICIVVNSKGNQPCIFVGRTDAEVKDPILGHLIRRADSPEKTPMLGKTEGRRRRGAAEDEMVR